MAEYMETEILLNSTKAILTCSMDSSIDLFTLFDYPNRYTVHNYTFNNLKALEMGPLRFIKMSPLQAL